MENYTKIQGKALNFNDFARIGGEIVSAPLNENFRRLVNGLSLSNTNLIFPEENATVSTIEEMMSLDSPLDGQTCYVVSNGSLYRFSRRDNQWYQIADFGQTFRQGFLNSGLIVAEDELKLIDEMTIRVPKMLVYFKNQEGDGRYLKGMYLIETKDIKLTAARDNAVEGLPGTNAGSYSILVDVNQHFKIISGMPKTDDPNWIYLGGFLIVKIAGVSTLLQDFIFTIPDIAYTADRGQFFLRSGDYTGLNLIPASETNKINRKAGFYYDEGINFAKGITDNFPIDTDNGSNFNIKKMEAMEPINKIWYASSIDTFRNNFIETPLILETTTEEGEVIQNYQFLIKDKYTKGSSIDNVQPGYYTIQHHLVLPNGVNLILYGTQIYNSMDDATTHLNSVKGLSVDFPHVESTRIVICNTKDELDVTDTRFCDFFTLEKLAQVGTIDPEFSDKEFKLYSGLAEDNTPSTVQFDLDALLDSTTGLDSKLGILSAKVTRPGFSLTKKYNYTPAEGETEAGYTVVEMQEEIERSYNNGENKGYLLADNEDVAFLVNRINEIEREIWHTDNKEEGDSFNNSIRYRLWHGERELLDHETRVAALEDEIILKADKSLTINGHDLSKSFILYTDDIQEKDANTTNLWFTQDRVNENDNVKNSVTHISKVGTGTQTDRNIHALATEDITVKQNSDRQFVTAAEKARIDITKIPEDTINELAKKIENIRIESIDGNSLNPGAEISTLGNIKAVRFYQDGVNLSVNEDTETLLLECVGQTDYDRMLLKKDFATMAMAEPDKFAGCVDKALDADFANNIYGITEAGASKYYGTNKLEEIGFFDLPTYITTAEANDFTELDQVIFVPTDGSITESHLEESLRDRIINNYHTIQDDGEIKSNEINTINFGNNLQVDIDGNTVTINATGIDGEAISKFVNLDDVEITYTNNAGKAVIVNDEETGLTVADMPSLDEFMLKTTYVDSTDPYKVKHAILADNATKATSAENAAAVNGIEINNDVQGNTLWTSEMIVNYITNNTPAILSGTEVPTTEQGKNGDIYILLGE